MYGKHITPNMHIHSHLKDCILDYGPLHGFWLFAFEHFSGPLGSLPQTTIALLSYNSWTGSLGTFFFLHLFLRSSWNNCHHLCLTHTTVLVPFKKVLVLNQSCLISPIGVHTHINAIKPKSPFLHITQRVCSSQGNYKG